MSPFLIALLALIAVVLPIAGALVFQAYRKHVELKHEIMPPVQAALPVRCVNCKHFDIEEGQAAIQQFPQFMKAAAVIPPTLMGAKAELVEVTNEDGSVEKVWKKTRNKGVPARTTWDDLGACMRPRESGDQLLVYNFDKCEHYEEKERS